MKFIFKDDEKNIMLIKWISYDNFRKAYDKLTEDCVVYHYFNNFYPMLVDRLNQTKKVSIKEINFYIH
jgi:hypothetical protein